MSLTREQLRALDKDTLVELVLGQSARIGELEASIATLTQQVAQLEARLNQTSKNSSKPPSSDSPFQALTSMTVLNRVLGLAALML